MLTLYTITALAFAVVTLLSGSKLIQTRESRKLKKILKNGRECEALILDVRPIKPSIFNTENIRLKVQILSEKPLVTEFDYDASYPEARELMTGKIITVDIDPSDRRSVMITRKSSRPSKPSAATSGSALFAI
jgi:hypothetical protein